MKKVVLVILLAFACNYSRATDYYWIRGDGYWSDLNHWALSSGGTVNPTVVPSAADNVIFDANSGFTAGYVNVRLDVTAATCHNISVSGCPAPPRFAGANLNIYGSSVWQAGVTLGMNTIYRSSGPETITTNGAAWVNCRVTFEGSGSWTLQDTLQIAGGSGNIEVLKGTFLTNNQSVFTGGLYVSKAGAVLNLGSSQVYVSTLFSTTVIGSVLHAGTSHIHFVGTYSAQGLYSKSGDTFYDVTFEEAGTTATIDSRATGGRANYHAVTFKGGGIFNGNNTFGKLLLGAGQLYVFGSATTQTVTDTLRVSGAHCSGWASLRNDLDRPAVINSPAGAHIDIRDAVITGMTATGGATFTAANSVDNGDNSGWSFGAVTGTPLYWVGGSGNWNDKAHWSASSGGTGGYCVPGPGDDVFIDAGSGLTPGSGLITVNNAVYCHDIIVSAAATELRSLSATVSRHELNIFGSSVWQPGMTYNVNTNYVSPDAETITSNGVATCSGSGYAVRLNGSGSWTLQDAFITGHNFYLGRGTFNTNNQDFSIGDFYGLGNGRSKIINLGSSQVYVTYQSFSTSDRFTTLNAGTAHIHFTGFYTNEGYDGIDAKSGDIYYDVTFENKVGRARLRSGAVFRNVSFRRDGLIKGANTFNELVLDGGYTYSLESGNTQRVNAALSTRTADCGGWVALQSETPGTAAQITSPVAAVIDVKTAIIRDITATGGAAFNAAASIDNGNNTGWSFSSVTGKTLYWVGGQGNWNDKSHWSALSGGTGGYCVPGPGDDVFIDAGSGFSTGSDSIIIDGPVYCHHITCNGSVLPPKLAARGNAILNIYGSSVWQSGMDYNIGTRYLSSGDETITSNGVVTGRLWPVIFNGKGSWTLQDAFVTGKGSASIGTQGILLEQGTFNTNNQDLTTSNLSGRSSAGRPVIINLGSSQVYITYAEFNTSEPNTTLNAGTSHIRFVLTAGGAAWLQPKKEDVYYDVTFERGGSIYSTEKVFTGTKFHRVDCKMGTSLTGNLVFGELVLYAGNTYTLGYGSTQTVTGRLYSSGNPCFILFLRTDAPGGPKANLCVRGGETLFDYVNAADINASCLPLQFGEHSSDAGGNSNMSFMPFSTGNILGLGPDRALPCTSYPAKIGTEGFFPNPSTVFRWQDASSGPVFNAAEPGQYRVSVNYGRGCTVSDTISLGYGAMPAVLVAAGKVSDNLDLCRADNGYLYYKGDGTNAADTQAVIAVHPNGNSWEPLAVVADNKGSYTGGGGTFSNSGAGYYQSTDGANTLRLSKRLYSIQAPGTYTSNGGVIVRVYYTDADTMAMLSDAFPGAATIAGKGWFKVRTGTAAAAVAAMTPEVLSPAEGMTPIARGVENGLKYAEFKVQRFSTIGYYAGTSAVPLPLELLSFTGRATGCTAVIEWQTGNNTTSGIFELQYSNDGRDYATVGTIAQHNRSRNYSLRIEQPDREGFYRLKMTDNTGRSSYSNSIQVLTECNAADIVLYPNPTTGKIRIKGLNPGTVMRVYTASGQFVLEQTAVRDIIDLSGMVPGVYHVVLTDATGKTVIHNINKTE